MGMVAGVCGAWETLGQGHQGRDRETSLTLLATSTPICERGEIVRCYMCTLGAASRSGRCKMRRRGHRSVSKNLVFEGFNEFRCTGVHKDLFTMEFTTFYNDSVIFSVLYKLCVWSFAIRKVIVLSFLRFLSSTTSVRRREGGVTSDKTFNNPFDHENDEEFLW